MPTECISFKRTGYFSSLICDYLDEKPELKPFYNHFPRLENFRKQIEEKHSSFNLLSRSVLVESLGLQYEGFEVSDSTLQNIQLLQQENTFTITTGHQLNLFTGPLYFLYKIVSTINLTNELKEVYPDYNFVPVYWMATEDHDFDEINYFNFKGKKIRWNRNSKGAVGELTTEGLKDVFELFSKDLGAGKHADGLRTLFSNAYLNHKNLADATRYLANNLFSEYGLVIIDANTKALKQLFVPYIKTELLNGASFKTVSETNSKIDKINSKYKIQVNPREINLFYLTKNLRERIVFEDNLYKVLNTEISWTKEDILSEVEKHPERFSPNVIMRPLYQEVILPNLCYIGGGGELAYWFQLKDFFKEFRIPFPVLLLRNSVLWINKKQKGKLQKLNLKVNDLFLKQEDLIAKVTKQLSGFEIDFTPQKQHLQQQFKDLFKLAEQTDKSFKGAVMAQERKQIKGLEHLEKRLLKAQKRKLQEVLGRVIKLQNKLFPNQSLQERYANFSELYLEYGEQLIAELTETLNPLESEFTILTP